MMASKKYHRFHSINGYGTHDFLEFFMLGMKANTTTIMTYEIENLVSKVLQIVYSQLNLNNQYKKPYFFKITRIYGGSAPKPPMGKK